MESSKLFLNRQFSEAMQGFDRAATLDPSNANYRMAALVARSHEVTALIQEAAKDRLLNNEVGARAALARALALDPTNFEASQHLDDLADESVRAQPKSLYGQVDGSGARTLKAVRSSQFAVDVVARSGFSCELRTMNCELQEFRRSRFRFGIKRTAASVRGPAR